jgi:hypothetical protein
MRRLREGGRGTAAAVVLFAASLASAADLTLETGASITLTGADLDLAGGDLAVSGTFDAGTGLVEQVRDLSILSGGALNGESATIQICGDWSNAGTFSAGTSSVSFLDGCGRSSVAISGDTTFFDLEMTTTSGKVYALASGSTQTVSDFLTLSGAPGNRLELQSTTPGSEALIDLQGGQSVSYVNVQDNHAIGNPIGLGADSSSLGNTLGWILVAVPSVTTLGLALLVGLMTLSAFAVERGRNAARG